MKIQPSCLLLILSFLFLSCESENRNSDATAETARMVARLDSIAQNVDPRLNEYAGSARVALLKRLPAPRTPEERMIFSGTLAQEMIYAGDTQEAVELL